MQFVAVADHIVFIFGMNAKRLTGVGIAVGKIRRVKRLTGITDVVNENTS